MVGRLRDPRQGSLRAAWPGLTASALLVAACGNSAPGPNVVVNVAGNGSGGGNAGGGNAGGGSAGSVGLGGLPQGGLLNVPPLQISDCKVVDYGPPVFMAQAVTSTFARELYSWTTDEQVSEIRAGKVLLTRTERAGLGPGYAVERLLQLVNDETEVGKLAAVLTSEPYSRGRYAWPNPWATRMGWPGETYGNRLLRMVLRPDAWLASFQRGTLMVWDANNTLVSLTDALAQPQRLAGFFFIKDSTVGGPFCGSFSGGGNVYREFIVCNESMIEEWSLDTETIRQRLLDDIANLETFLSRIRACPTRQSEQEWNLSVGCNWQRGFFGTFEQAQYEAALAMPSPAYLPAAAQLAALIDALQSDLFEIDPLVVRPGG